MSVPRWFLRPKALAALACAAVLAPVAVVAGGVASARESTATTAQAQPTVDAASLYDRFYEMAGSFSYRISGADGDPRDPADPFNVAADGQRLAGARTAYWKHALHHRGRPLVARGSRRYRITSSAATAGTASTRTTPR